MLGARGTSTALRLLSTCRCAWRPGFPLTRRWAVFPRGCRAQSLRDWSRSRICRSARWIRHLPHCSDRPRLSLRRPRSFRRLLLLLHRPLLRRRQNMRGIAPNSRRRSCNPLRLPRRRLRLKVQLRQPPPRPRSRRRERQSPARPAPPAPKAHRGRLLLQRRLPIAPRRRRGARRSSTPGCASAWSCWLPQPWGWNWRSPCAAGRAGHRLRSRSAASEPRKRSSFHRLRR